MAKQSKKKQVLNELEKFPNVSFACQKVGISRQTFYRWKRTNIQFAQKVKGAIEMGDSYLCDLGENQLVKKMHAGEWPSIKYYLNKRHPKYKKVENRQSQEQKNESVFTEEELRAQEYAFGLLPTDEEFRDSV